MKHALLIATSLAAFALSGCKKDETPAADVAATTAPADVSAGTVAPAAVNADQAFANTLAASDRFEIESSQLAATRAKSAGIKKFADAMIKAHTDSSAKLKTAAATASPAITPVADLTPAQQTVLADLSAQSGEAFDTAYAKAQTDAHQSALDSLNAYASGGAQPSLKALAAELIPVVTAHFNMVKGL